MIVMKIIMILMRMTVTVTVRILGMTRVNLSTHKHFRSFDPPTKHFLTSYNQSPNSYHHSRHHIITVLLLIIIIMSLHPKHSVISLWKFQIDPAKITFS